MGTHRSYVRLTEVELGQALQDRDWAKARLDPGAPRQPSISSELYLNVDKAWFEIDIVFSYAGVDIDAHIGLRPLYVETAPGPDDYSWDEMSYVERRGIDPYYLTPGEVLSVAPRITTIPFDAMFDAVDPTRVQGLQEWQQAEWPEYRDYAIFHGVKAQRFFRAAAEAGDAMAVWFR
jgi:Domain of unknown function (DUF1877)